MVHFLRKWFHIQFPSSSVFSEKVYFVEIIPWSVADDEDMLFLDQVVQVEACLKRIVNKFLSAQKLGEYNYVFSLWDTTTPALRHLGLYL